MRQFLQKNWQYLLVIILILGVVSKYFATNFLYSIPLGYDAGMYRYLFLKYASVPQFFAFPELIGWEARQSPVSLWLIGRVIHSGVSVDVILTWGWSAVMTMLLLGFAYYIYKTEGLLVAIGVLIAAICSMSIYEVYSYMYWKTAVGLIVLLVIIHLLQKKRVILAALCVVLLAGVHHLTALFAILVCVTWWIWLRITKQVSLKYWSMLTAILACIGLTCLLWYIDSLGFVRTQLENVFLRESTKSSSFPSTTSWLKYSWFILGIALIGTYDVFKKRGILVWHHVLVIASILVIIKIYFYRRFYIFIDLASLYFFAHGLLYIWHKTQRVTLRGVLCLLIACIAVYSYKPMLQETFTVTEQEFYDITQLSTLISNDTTVIVPENLSAFYIAGWLPNHTVRAPGLLNDSLAYKKWQELLFGTEEQRKKIFRTFPENSVIVTMPSFYRFYGNKADNFLVDSCLTPRIGTPILQIECN